jgi:hypothetical protein
VTTGLSDIFLVDLIVDTERGAGRFLGVVDVVVDVVVFVVVDVVVFVVVFVVCFVNVPSLPMVNRVPFPILRSERWVDGFIDRMVMLPMRVSGLSIGRSRGWIGSAAMSSKQSKGRGGRGAQPKVLSTVSTGASSSLSLTQNVSPNGSFFGSFFGLKRSTSSVQKIGAPQASSS